MVENRSVVARGYEWGEDVITKGQQNGAFGGSGKFCILICAGGGPTNICMC